MKRGFLLFISLILLVSGSFAQGINFEKGDWASVLEKAKTTRRPIFVDVKTVWCKPCKVMDNEVFPDASVGDYFNRKYVSVIIDAEIGEGIELAKKFGATSFPTLVFLNSDGEFVFKKAGAVSSTHLMELAKAAKSKNASELNEKISRFEDGKFNQDELPGYISLLNEEKLNCTPALDEYVKGLSKKERVSTAVFEMIDKYTRDPSSYSVKYIVENYKKYEDKVDENDLETFICKIYVFESYRNTLGFEDKNDLYKYLIKNKIPYAPAIKESNTLVNYYLKETEGHDEYIRRSELLFKNYPAIYPYTLNETVKHVVNNPKMTRHAVNAINAFAKINKNRAARTSASLATLYSINARDYANALVYFKQANKWSDEKDYCKSSIEYCERSLGLTKSDNFGDQAPDFTLPDMDGKMHSLKDFRGKLVLIDFWASWCGPCKGETPWLKNAHKLFGGKDFVLISITIDEDDEAWKKSVEHEGMTWLQLTANKTDIAEKFKVKGIPRIMLLDKEGEIFADKLRNVAMEREIKKALEL